MQFERAITNVFHRSSKLTSRQIVPAFEFFNLIKPKQCQIMTVVIIIIPTVLLPAKSVFLDNVHAVDQ